MSTIVFTPAPLMTTPPSSSSSAQSGRGGRSAGGSSRAPLICSFCGGHFQRSNGLKRHMRIHTGERPYPCSHCDAAFTRTDLIRRHLLLNHGIDSSGARAGTSTANRRRASAAPGSAAQDPQRSRGNASVLQTSPTVESASAGAAAGPSQHVAVNFPALGPLTFDASAAAMERPMGPARMPDAGWHHPSLDHLFDFVVPSPAPVPAPSSTTGASSLPMIMSTASVSPSLPHHALHQTPPTEWVPRRHLESTSVSTLSPASNGLNLFGTPSASHSLPTQSSGHAVLNDRYPPPRIQHLRLFAMHFAKHLPCIHAPTYEGLHFSLHQDSTTSVASVSDADSDLLRAMAIVGAAYDGEYQPEPPSELYGAAELQSRLLAARTDKGDGTGHGRYKQRRPSLFASGSGESSDDVTLRQGQTLLLLQVVWLFGRSAYRQNQARQLQGFLVAAARDLLQYHRTETAGALLPFASTARTVGEAWRKWSASEERLRTIWMIYACDSLVSVFWHSPPLLSLSELSDLAPPCDEALWQASDAVQWAEHASALHHIDTNGSRRHSAPGLSSYMGRYPGQQSVEGHVSLDASALLAIATSSLRAVSLSDAHSELFSQATSTPSPSLTDTTTTAMLLLAVSLCRDVVDLGRTDLSARQHHASTASHQRQAPSHLASIDEHLNRRIHELEAALGRWLEAFSLVDDPYRTADASVGVPFPFEPMPWYWAASHYVAQLRARLATTSSRMDPRDGRPSRPTHQQLDMWDPQASAAAFVAEPSGGAAFHPSSNQMASSQHMASPSSWPSPCTPQGPNSTMCFLVHLRSSMRSVDGGADLLRSLGAPWTPEYEARVVTASRTDPASLLGFFPPLSSQP